MVGTRSSKVRPNTKVGHLLREARRDRRLTLAQVAADLTMPLKQLQALEEGDFSVFAAEVYGRGAYVRYAKYLGISGKVAERAVFGALSEAREAVPLRVHRPLTWFQSMLTPRMVILVALLGVGLVVGGYIIWQVQAFLRLPRLQLASPSAAEVTASQVTVEGKAQESARVSVNGEPVLLQDGGAFTHVISLHPGINVLRLEAENAAGRKRVIERHLLWPRS